tara:strand:+ start:4206 stop:4667 length:462 start_codon:yes stop_codon:yes gene_type:complete
MKNTKKTPLKFIDPITGIAQGIGRSGGHDLATILGQQAQSPQPMVNTSTINNPTAGYVDQSTQIEPLMSTDVNFDPAAMAHSQLSSVQPRRNQWRPEAAAQPVYKGNPNPTGSFKPGAIDAANQIFGGPNELQASLAPIPQDIDDVGINSLYS